MAARTCSAVVSITRYAGLFITITGYQWARHEKLDRLEEQWSSPATQEQLQLVRQFRRVLCEQSRTNYADSCATLLLSSAPVTRGQQQLVRHFRRTSAARVTPRSWRS